MIIDRRPNQPVRKKGKVMFPVSTVNPLTTNGALPSKDCDHAIALPHLTAITIHARLWIFPYYLIDKKGLF